ncbi:transporter substrate-binding domain-containing protein [Salmonella enterica]|nr:transporter substrate-binding domain-containing protein [Salmonella enterica]EDJ9072794.1 ABC transporter substrate-binding protein [Salmonella enterica subsp. enterica serovar Typhimurium]EDN6661526.1 transporter substrate-binding domain-containing protein [Salmonella enterica]EKQ1727742.1 transporter substrate-binding domain-containing protein [Salmonella enterica]
MGLIPVKRDPIWQGRWMNLSFSPHSERYKQMLRVFRGLICVLFFYPPFVPASGNLSSDITLKVGIYASQPFVMHSGKGINGLAVELWEGFAEQQHIRFRYQEYPTVSALLDAVHREEVDVAVSNVTLTEERAARMAFTFPWYDSGLRIMVSGEKGGDPWRTFWSGMTDAGHVEVYLLIVAGILVGTVLLTVLDRKLDDTFPVSWFDGLAEDFYHVMSIFTTGRTTHKLLFGSAGKIIAGIWMVCGVTVVAYITSSITSTMTASNLQSIIRGPSDLRGDITGVRTGSEAEKYLRRNGMEPVEYEHLYDAVAALRSGKIQAIVADAPTLEYYVKENPMAGMKLVGNTFYPEKFGFALPLDSQYTHHLSKWLIGLHQSGELNRLREKYFGRET